MAGVGETERQSGLATLGDRLDDLSPSIVLPTLAITLNEVLLFLGYSDLALWGHFLTLLGCVLAPLKFDNDIPMLQVFALLPIFRLVNLGMPVFVELTIYWFPLVYAPLLPAIYVVWQSADTPDITFAPRVFAAAVIPGIFMGMFLGHIEYEIIEPAGLIPTWDLWNVTFITVVMIGFVGFVEELLYRGLLQRALQTRIGRWGGLLLSAALFGLMHSAYSSPAEIVFAGAIGLLFGLIYDASDSIFLITVIHGVLNIFLFAVIPLQGPLFGAV